jgi:hypothetical protein
MSAVCPACGLAVVPGYVKCPKCQAALPRRPRTFAAGGTAVRDEKFPVVAIAVPGALVFVLLIWLLARGCGGSSSDEVGEDAAVAVAQQPAQQTGQQAPRTTIAQPDNPTTPNQPAGPDPRAAAAELERSLRGRRFWSTIELSGNTIDVRSGSCDDAGMRQTIDGAASSLRGAGLTRLRCLAQSGAVVFERDL